MSKEKESVKEEVKAVEKKGPKSLVNMTLTTGTHLVMGQPVTLSEEDEKYLRTHFKKEDLGLIVEGLK